MADEKIITKSFETNIIDADDESVFIIISGWRMRVYFADNKVNPIGYKGRTIKVDYVGDLADVYTLKLMPITL
jgi:hypothetical protein